MKNKYLSIIVPVLNEQWNIKPLYKDIINIVEKENINYEIIFINDFSNDKTAKKIFELKENNSNVISIENQKNLGIYNSWKIGLEAANGELICFIDGDLQTNPGQIASLLKIYETNNCDLVKGCRYDFSGSFSIRYFYSRILNFILNFLFFMTSKDNKSGFILGKKDDLTDILNFKNNYYYGQTFLSISAKSKGYNILEHPSIFEKRRNNYSFISAFPLKIIFLILIDLFLAFFEFNFFTKKNNELERFLIRKNKNQLNNEISFTKKIGWKLYVFLTFLHKFNIKWKFNNKLESLLKSQYLSNAELKEYQLIKLKKILRHSFGNVPYYNQLFKEIKFNPRNVSSLEDLKKITPLEKLTLKKNVGFELISINVNFDKVHKITTSGSTGEPLNLYVDHDQLEWRFANTIRGFFWAGWKPFDKNIRLWHQNLGLNFIEELKEKFDAYLSNRKFIPAYEFDIKKTENLINDLSKENNCIVDGYAESFEYIAKIINKKKIKNNFNIKAIISSAQSLTNQSKKNIENFFQTKVYDKYGAREFSGIAFENKEFNGHLINMESYIVELVKISGSIEKSKNIGEVYITDLNNMVTPLIRYKIGDIAEITNYDLNKCELKFDRLGEIEGRVTSIVNLPNGKWMPGTFFAHFFKDYESYIDKYQIIQKSMELIEIYIVPTESYNENIEKNIRIKINQYIKDIDIKFIIKDKIEMVRTGKFNSVLNLIEENNDNI